jgi:hypothetical protein
MPGHALVVLDPQAMLMTDVFPCEDAYAQERSLLVEVLATVAAHDCWIADRNFCTTEFLFGIKRHGAFFGIRQHASTLTGKRLQGKRTDQALRSEINTLGYPKSALLCFSIGVVLYNTMSVPRRRFLYLLHLRLIGIAGQPPQPPKDGGAGGHSPPYITSLTAVVGVDAVAEKGSATPDSRQWNAKSATAFGEHSRR